METETSSLYVLENKFDAVSDDSPTVKHRACMEWLYVGDDVFYYDQVSLHVPCAVLVGSMNCILFQSFIYYNC
jgi:galactose-1-phosphate uridylyltransferase